MKRSSSNEKTEPTLRGRVLEVIGNDLVTSHSIVHRTGLTPKTVNTIISALVNRTGVLERVVTTGGVRYRRVGAVSDTTAEQCSVCAPISKMRDLELKLAQLRSHRDALRKSGLSLVDSLIDDLDTIRAVADLQKKFYTTGLNNGSTTSQTPDCSNRRTFFCSDDTDENFEKDHSRPLEKGGSFLLPP